MKINYNITGEKRKSLVGAISQELNAPAKYLRAPTFAYEVGGYLIDKNGKLTGPDSLDLEADLQSIHGFTATEREYDEPDTYESGLGGMGATPSIGEISDDAAVWVEREMHRMKLENSNVPDYSNRGQYGGDDVPAFEELRMTENEELGLGKERHEDFQGENGMQSSDAPKSDEAYNLTIEIPRSAFTDAMLENLKRLVESKSSLIKRALGISETPLEVLEETIRFPWFSAVTDAEAVKAYTHFVTALCEMAKTQHRVSAVDKPVENEKYAFRCFLLRLGFIGDEYKVERKILLSRLTGSSAFKNPTMGGGDNE